MRSVLSLAGVFLLAAPPPHQAASLIVNGSFLDLDGSARSAVTPPHVQGGIAQTFATTPGTRYRVTFDLAGNPNQLPRGKRMRLSLTVSPQTGYGAAIDNVAVIPDPRPFAPQSDPVFTVLSHFSTPPSTRPRCCFC